MAKSHGFSGLYATLNFARSYYSKLRLLALLVVKRVKNAIYVNIKKTKNLRI